MMEFDYDDLVKRGIIREVTIKPTWAGFAVFAVDDGENIVEDGFSFPTRTKAIDHICDRGGFALVQGETW